MSNIKISELPEATSISDNDLLVVVNSGDPYVTKHIKWNNIDSPQDGIIYGRKDGNWIDITSPANLQLRSGLSYEVSGIIPLQGEPVWTTDTQKLVIGDGNQLGGIAINAAGYTKPFDLGTGPIAYNSGHYITLDNVVWKNQDAPIKYGYTETSGNLRGVGSIDLSLSRNDPSQVASGNFSFIAGGCCNTAIGQYSFIGAGRGAETIGNDSASLCGGKTTRSSMFSMGTAKASSPVWGDGKYSEHFLLSIGTKTTNSTATTIRSGGDLYTLILSENTMSIFGILQIATINETTGEAVAHFSRKFAVQRLSGGTPTVKDFSVIGTDYNPNGYSLTGLAAAGGIFVVRVTGDSNTLRWICTIDGIMVSI